MRVALISDIHGNDVALKAVLKDIRSSGADQVVCLGDVATLGPAPNAVIQRLRSLQCPCIQGNHDDFLIAPELIKKYTQEESVLDAVDWCRDQLNADELDWLKTFEPIMEIMLDGVNNLVLFHGSPASHMENILARTPGAEVDRMCKGVRAEIMGCGHTHIQMFRKHRGRIIVNPGSVGLPFIEFLVKKTPELQDHGEYALVTAQHGNISVDLRRVALDKKAMRQAAEASSIPLRDWLMEQYQ